MTLAEKVGQLNQFNGGIVQDLSHLIMNIIINVLMVYVMEV